MQNRVICLDLDPDSDHGHVLYVALIKDPDITDRAYVYYAKVSKNPGDGTTPYEQLYGVRADYHMNHREAIAYFGAIRSKRFAANYQLVFDTYSVRSVPDRFVRYATQKVRELLADCTDLSSRLDALKHPYDDDDTHPAAALYAASTLTAKKKFAERKAQLRATPVRDEASRIRVKGKKRPERKQPVAPSPGTVLASDKCGSCGFPRSDHHALHHKFVERHTTLPTETSKPTEEAHVEKVPQHHPRFKWR